MPKFKNKYRIESNRWQNWNYSNIGNYFITICTNNREMIFGSISDGEMNLSKLGEIVKKEIDEIPMYYEGVGVDEWIIMPNHVHLIITIVETIHELSLHELSLPNDEQYRKKRRQMTISKVIGKFKMKTSKQINTINKSEGYKNWQPNYHDHVIRNEKEYNRIKQYIINNPANWQKDKFFI